MERTQTPEWLAATLRYSLALVGVALVTTDVLPQTAWDQIAAATTTLVTVIYGIWRTRQVERKLNSKDRQLEIAVDIIVQNNQKSAGTTEGLI